MLEFLDFMEGLRRRCGRQQPLIVLLCGDRNGVTERDRKTWQLTLQRLGDPDLHVEVLGPAS
jgi:hypothetical protein